MTREQEVRLAWAKTRLASLHAAAMYDPRAVADAMEAERQMDRAQRTLSEAAWTVADVERALGELRTAGVRVADVRTPNLSHLAVSGTLDLPLGAWVHGIATPAEDPTNPDVTHSAEQESIHGEHPDPTCRPHLAGGGGPRRPDGHSDMGADSAERGAPVDPEDVVTELSVSREPTPEERRDAWVVLATKLEGWLLGTEQRALQAADLHRVLAAYRPPGMVSRDGEAQKARAWAARRLLEHVQAWEPPVVPRDDEKGQGSILELFPGAEEALARPLDVEVLTGESTAVENPVEEGPMEERLVHAVTVEGAGLHASHTPFSDDYSSNWARVTCKTCRQIGLAEAEPNAAGCRGECGLQHGPDGECL